MVEPLRAVPSVQVLPCKPPDLAPPRPPRSPAVAAIDVRKITLESFLNNEYGEKPNSRKAYEREISRFLDWTTTHSRRQAFPDIRSGDIINYKVYLQKTLTQAQAQAKAKVESEWVTGQEGKQKKIYEGPVGLAPNSVNRALIALKAFFSWLLKANKIETNPTAAVGLVQVDASGFQDLTAEEIKRVWAAIMAKPKNRLRNLALLHVLIHGLRAGEVASLSLASLHEDEGYLVLTGTKNNEERYVPLRPASLEQIKLYLEERTEAGEELSLTSPLFVSSHSQHQGKRLTYNGIFQAIKAIGYRVFPEKEEGKYLRTLHPHQFRHTAACELLIMGLDPTHVKTILGHKTDKMLHLYGKRLAKEAAVKCFHTLLEANPDGQLPLTPGAGAPGVNDTADESGDHTPDTVLADADDERLFVPESAGLSDSALEPCRPPPRRHRRR